ncbi:MAG: hypothetical protein ACK5Y2_12240 [Bdellovibrionales bacterium]
MGLGSGAYLGALQLQAQWESETRTRHALVSYGITQDSIVGEIRQYSTSYQWSPGEVRTEKWVWDPLLVGGFLTYTDNDSYFFHSPSRYNNDAYYNVTNLRWGARFSSQLMALHWGSRPVHLSVDGSLLEKGVIAWFNNPLELDIFKYFWSLGFSVRVAF